MDKKNYEVLRAKWAHIKQQINNYEVKNAEDFLYVNKLEQEAEKLEQKITILWRKINDQL